MMSAGDQQSLIDAFVEIWQIVHTPTPRKTPANEHYARDFDRIRVLLKPFISPQHPQEKSK